PAPCASTSAAAGSAGACQIALNVVPALSIEVFSVTAIRTLRCAIVGRAAEAVNIFTRRRYHRESRNTASSAVPKTLALRHVPFEDLGLLEPLLVELGHDIVYVEAPTSDLSQIDALA